MEDARTVGYSPVENIADIQRVLRVPPQHRAGQCLFSPPLRWNAPALAAHLGRLDLMRDATQAHRHREDADFAFHCAIAKASNNHYYICPACLKDHIAVGMKFHGVSLMGPNSGLAGVFTSMRRSLVPFASGMATPPAPLLRQHLEGSRDRIFEGRALDLAL